MRKYWLVGIAVLALAAGLVSAGRDVTAQATLPSTPPGVSQAGVSNALPASISSFTVSNPYCYQPDPSLNQCSLNFRYVSVTDNQTTPPYLVYLTIAVNNKIRYSANTFFENTIYYSYDMAPGGWKVPCGTPNAGGAGTQYGLVYTVLITPLDGSRGTMNTWDSANITCPAYAP